MSNVLSRFRKISEWEFYRTASELRVKLARALMSDRIVPKHWRMVISIPAIERANLMIDHIRAAFNIYPYNADLLAEKRLLQQAAINDLDGIDDKLQFLLDIQYYGQIDADHLLPPQLEECGELIDRENELLIAWKKGTKILK